MRPRVVAAMVAFALVSAFGAAPATAAVEPPPVTLPPIPAPVSSALGIGAPVLQAECGTFITALTLIVPAVAGGLPVDPVPLLSSVIQVCGSIPQPSVLFHCGADDAVANELAGLLGSLKILLAVVNTRVAAPVAEEIGMFEALVPQAALLANVATLADQLLQCQQVKTSGQSALPPPSAPPTEPPPPPTGESGPSVSSGEPDVAPPPVSSAPAASTTPTSGPAEANGTLAAPQLYRPATQVAAAPRGVTPVGSAAIGFLLVLVAAALVWARSARQGQSG